MSISNRLKGQLKWASRATGRRLFTLADLLWPKDDNLVLFTRDKFADNSRPLFEAITRSDSQLRAVWLAKSYQQMVEIRQAVPGAHVVLQRSAAGMIASLRARVVTLTVGMYQMAPFSSMSNRKIIVMLWHAISFKRSKGLHNSRSSEFTRAYDKEASRYAVVIASSEQDRASKALTFGIDRSKVVVTGLPRTDVLLETERPRSTLPAGLDAALEARTILYAPTWRDEGETTRFFPFPDFKPESLNRFLVERGAYLLFRPHKFDTLNIHNARTWSQDGLDRLVLATSDTVPDVANILNDVDVIVTDYSSIYLDTIVTDTPMVFVPYDIDSYLAKRGLLYDYEEVTPGPKVSTQAEFEAALLDALEGAPAYAAGRQALRDRFHQYVDGQATARVIDLIKKLIRDRTPYPAQFE